ncbi:hypothetical protein EVG20_g929 [Dentipellis fragilis]|uniref:EF-hand domain-containing protein n=1 Tax=Dentipellis fragilis TaxID=205917 RepID=A0A4Y9ZB93_9AGAM|nr:hypothetical protein EVG20_g929 [Dentipellis fragilis]
MTDPTGSSRNHTEDPLLLDRHSSGSSASSPQIPARNPPPRLRLEGHDIFDTEDFHPALPSPPYKTFASTTNLHAAAESYHQQQTPPYRSQVELMNTAHDDHDRDPDAKVPVDDQKGDDKTPVKPSVHYHEDVGPAPTYRAAPPRMDTDELYKIHSRASSFAETDDEEDESEDYDWSNEEDLVDEETKFEAQMGRAQHKKGWGFRRIITLLFGSLIGSMFIAGLIVTGPLIALFYWYKPHPSESRHYTMENIEAWTFWAAANVLLSWWFAMFIDIAPVVFRGVIAFVWGHVSEKVKTRIELYNSVKNTIKPLFYAASAWVSWIILFQSIFKLHDPNNPGQSRAQYTERLSDVIEFLFFLVLVWCAQKMLSHAIAFAFHRVAFKERIDELRESLGVIEHLRDYRPKKTRNRHGRSRTPVFASLGLGAGSAANTPGGMEENKRFSWTPHSRAVTPEPVGTPENIQTDSEEWEGDVEEGHSGKGKGKWLRKSKGKGKGKAKSKRFSGMPNASGSSTPDVVSPRDESPATASPHRYPPTSPPHGSNNGLGDYRRDDSDDESEMVVMQAAKVLKNAVLHDARNIQGKEGGERGLVWDVSNAHEAKRLARLIYTTFRDRRRRYLLPSDFEPAYHTPEEAQKAFRIFDTDNNGDISRAEIKTKLLKTYRERRFLSRSMRDVGAALHTLDRILLFFAAVILFFVSLSIFHVNIDQSLTSVYTIGIGASFIFKNSASNAFDAIMFLFVTHPFDTGDRCFIDEENLVVKKMGLFATIFARADGTETYYFNSQLFNKFITNVRRSDKTFENLTMQVAWRTPLEKLDELEKCLNDWLAKDENRWFAAGTSITPQNILFQRHLEITIGIGRLGPPQRAPHRLPRRRPILLPPARHRRARGPHAHRLGGRAHRTYEASPSSEHIDLFPPSPAASQRSHVTAHSRLSQSFLPGDTPDLSQAQAQVDKQPGQAAAPTATEGARGKPPMKRNWLGFVPPENQGGTEMRARKSVSKKAAMRSLGADG